MKLILLSGGSGKRLWPMSNDIRSKQFLRVLPVEGQDAPESMLQRVWRQLRACGLQQDAYVCASRAQSEIIHAQIGDVSVIEEPARRDTFAAIAMSVLYLVDHVGVGLEEPIAICPVDHFVDDHYFKEIQTLGELLTSEGADIALMGVSPTEPTSKFGYIVPEARPSGTAAFRVHRFVEKPDTATASSLIELGALWNCGVFCFRAGTITRLLEERRLPTSYEASLQRFQDFPKRSFDYEVVERMTSIVAHPYDGTWMDLGTWPALAEQMGRKTVGWAIASQSEDTHVINELGIPVVALGLSDAIVVATPDGILAADKSLSTGLKDVVNPLQNRPMYEERKWGTYRVLDYQTLSDGTEVLTKCIQLYPNENLSYHRHSLREEIWTILEGEGEVVKGHDRFLVGPGDVVRVDAGVWHAIRTTDGLQFIEVQRGSELVEEDIERKYLTWSELEQGLRSMLDSTAN
ncbi:sugar phosphate nucleotidyltransferase [Alicyclobacillus acidiphilus]|uniref:sugar phosphate nucleotidyltransferase n=1 Tax=Alicyclobacillus acidiphilus TaxID=182455 RepID=UPI000833E24E|nr:sugar phosphate nucleotidyltransferase [Alicyclobacillus acidiphilus]